MATQEFVDFEVEADFSNVKPMEGGKYDLVAEGSYIVDIVGVVQDESSTNKPMVTVEFMIAEGQDNDESAKFTGQHLWGNYFLTQKALGRLFNLMKACGAPLDKFRASAIYGAKLRLDVVHNQGDQRTDENGNPLAIKTFANVCKERPVDEGAAVESTPPPPVTKAATKPTTSAAKPAANGAGAARRA
jgi:hypothetical protein